MKLTDDLRALLDGLPLMAAVVDIEGRVYWANRYAAVVTGIDDPVGRSVDDFYHVEGPTVAEFARRTLETGKPIRKLRAGVTTTGHYIVVQATQFPLDDERVLATGIDVTADLRLAARTRMTGAPAEPRKPASVPEAFLRLVLDGAEVSEISAALDMSANDVYARLARLIG